jgi:cobalt-zinc-cadmium efflux system protein
MENTDQNKENQDLHDHSHHDHAGHDHSDHDHSDHDHNHGSGMHVHPVVNNMWIALFLNLAFTVIEFIGGFLTNSVAILSDAVHDLGDSIAIIAALVLEKQSIKGRSKLFSYGKRRFSVLAALITSLVLIVSSVFILTQVIPRFYNPQVVNARGVLGLAVLGLVFNGAAVFRLRKGSSSSLNQKAVMLHLMEDVLGWIAVLIGGTIMYFTKWYWIDPVLSLGITAFIVYNAGKTMFATLKILLQAVPETFDQEGLLSKLESIPGIVSVHDLHSWTLDGEKNILTVHIVTEPLIASENLHSIKAQLFEIFLQYKIHHPTIQFETTNEKCELLTC